MSTDLIPIGLFFIVNIICLFIRLLSKPKHSQPSLRLRHIPIIAITGMMVTATVLRLDRDQSQQAIIAGMVSAALAMVLAISYRRRR